MGGESNNSCGRTVEIPKEPQKSSSDKMAPYLYEVLTGVQLAKAGGKDRSFLVRSKRPKRRGSKQRSGSLNGDISSKELESESDGSRWQLSLNHHTSGHCQGVTTFTSVAELHEKVLISIARHSESQSPSTPVYIRLNGKGSQYSIQLKALDH